MNAADAGSPRTFPFRIGARSRLFLRLLYGVRPGRQAVEVDQEVRVKFGYFGFSVPVANISGWRIEGPWTWLTAIGIRRSIRCADVTFAGSPRGGVRLDFQRPVRWGPLLVPAIYLGVEDTEGFAAMLEGRGIPGLDARS